jgi:predicted alpha/beta-hydrolase family hydrolase
VPEPQLTTYDAPGRPRALVLMLHGGKQSSMQAVTGRSASWRRCLVMQRSIARQAQEAGVSTWLLRYGVIGWNDPRRPSPVPDARWALDQVRARVGEVPVVLLGHSMGARTAVHVADDPLVTGVVALAPWFPTGEPIRTLSGRHLVAAHGRGDRITSYGATRQYVARARVVTASAEMVDMGRIGHYMLRDVEAWNRLAIDRSLRILGPSAPST